MCVKVEAVDGVSLHQIAILMTFFASRGLVFIQNGKTGCIERLLDNQLDSIDWDLKKGSWVVLGSRLFFVGTVEFTIDISGKVHDRRAVAGSGKDPLFSICMCVTFLPHGTGKCAGIPQRRSSMGQEIFLCAAPHPCY
jgi:hypothetical protein